jgi:hypothetical protein
MNDNDFAWEHTQLSFNLLRIKVEITTIDATGIVTVTGRSVLLGN